MNPPRKVVEDSTKVKFKVDLPQADALDLPLVPGSQRVVVGWREPGGLQAVVDAADSYPVCLPSLAEGFDVLDILDRLDGLFLTGSPSNVEPKHYLGSPSEPGTWHDPERDIAALALIPAAIRAGMPLLAVCRGFQEMNVSFGGSLHAHVHEIPGYRVPSAAMPKNASCGPLATENLKPDALSAIR